MKTRYMESAMHKLMKSASMVCAAGLLAAVQAASPLTREVDDQKSLQSRWDRIVARAGLEFGMVAEGEYLKSEVDGSLSNPDNETIDKEQSTLVDLRIGARPWSELGGEVIIRFQQDWQTYFSNRSRPIHLRWAQMNGKALGKIAYAVGDFKEKWSPLTLWSPELELLMEAPIFAQAREEAMAEEFVGDNNRVLQGAKINAVIPFGDVVEWRLDGYASRVRRAEYLDDTLVTLDANKHAAMMVAKHGGEFGVASDLEQWSFGANTEVLVLKNAYVGGSFVWTFEDPKTWRANDEPLRADSGYSLNGQNWYLDNLWATDNKVISVRGGADVAGFLGMKNLVLDVVGEFAMSGLSYDWLPPANEGSHQTVAGLNRGQIDSLKRVFRVDPASFVETPTSITGSGAGADTVFTLDYDVAGITPPDEQEGNAIYAELNAGWKTDVFSAVVNGKFISVDTSFHNLMAQSPTFRAERIMNVENDLSSAGVAAPLYSAFDALYQYRPKASPLRNQPYQQAPYMQNAYTNSIGTNKFVPDPDLQLMLPFGYATPNRQGVDLRLDGGLNGKLAVQGVFAMMEEKEAEAGYADKTKFTKFGGGAMVDVAGFAGWKRQLQLSGSYTLTKADYSFAVPVVDGEGNTVITASEDTYSSAMINAGLSWEFYDKFFLLGGYQRIAATWDNDPVERTQQQWRAGIQYRLKGNSYAQWSVGQVLVDTETPDPTGAAATVSNDFSQFLTQVKIRAEF